ncbi:MAG TPA: right-handed parallel beta-helix repeat-containing protein [Gemmataceae bacterium]
MRLPTCILAGLFAVSLTPSPAPAADPPTPLTFHVAPDGDDRNPGTSDKPFATLRRARDAVRAAKRDRPVTVQVADGTYRLSEPFVLAPEDSGTKDAPVTYAAAPGARPVFSGGRRITGWKETTVNGRKLWTAEIPEVREGKWYFHQLWVNGERRTRARHPNKGFLRIAELPDVTPKTPRYPGQKRFRFKEGDIRAWENLGDVDVVALHLWVAVRLAVEGVDEEENIVRFRKESRRTLLDGSEPARYYVENAPELLDAPGEWYLNRKTGTLAYMPMPGEAIDKLDATAPALPQLVRFEGQPEKGRFVEHVTLRGLTFAHADWWPQRSDTCDAQAAAEVPAVLHGDGVRHCAIEGCTVAHASGYGIHLARGCSHNRVARCEVTDLGAGGVRLGETRIRDSEAEQTYSNEVADNHLHRLGRIFHQAVGVWIGQSYKNTVAHNHIHDLFYTGISCGWTWGYGKALARENVIEFNHVHHIGQGLLSDMGGIYTLGVQPGTVIRNNVFHDVAAYRYGGWGIYFDEGSTHIVAEKNLTYRTTDAGFHQHYGRENVVRNNVLAYGRDVQVRRTRVEPHLSFTFERNIVYWDSGSLLGGNWKEINARFDHNLYFHAGGEEIRFAGMTWEQWRAKGQDEHSRVADPLFANPEKADFRLRDGSPAPELGFERVDWSKAGVRR